jgi:hemerythrin-like metal-binding protein
MIWKEEYSVGNDLLDAQHRRLIELVNRVDGEESLDDILAELERYAEEHFRDEERLLESVGYPDLDKQQHQHAAFSSWLERLHREHREDGGGAVTRHDLQRYLRVWLANHLLVYDMAFKSWLK